MVVVCDLPVGWVWLLVVSGLVLFDVAWLFGG